MMDDSDRRKAGPKWEEGVCDKAPESFQSSACPKRQLLSET